MQTSASYPSSRSRLRSGLRLIGTADIEDHAALDFHVLPRYESALAIFIWTLAVLNRELFCILVRRRICQVDRLRVVDLFFLPRLPSAVDENFKLIWRIDSPPKDQLVWRSTQLSLTTSFSRRPVFRSHEVVCEPHFQFVIWIHQRRCCASHSFQSGGSALSF